MLNLRVVLHITVLHYFIKSYFIEPTLGKFTYHSSSGDGGQKTKTLKSTEVLWQAATHTARSWNAFGAEDMKQSWE